MNRAVHNENLIRCDEQKARMIQKRAMVAFLTRILLIMLARFKSRERLEAENIVLRQQIIVLSRRVRRRVRLRNIDRLIFVSLYRLLPSILDAVVVVKPETVVR